jgi:hypothetical protein
VDAAGPGERDTPAVLAEGGPDQTIEYTPVA